MLNMQRRKIEQETAIRYHGKAVELPTSLEGNRPSRGVEKNTLVGERLASLVNMQNVVAA